MMKSDLQLKLEQEGWTFLLNEYVDKDHVKVPVKKRTFSISFLNSLHQHLGYKYELQSRAQPKTDEEIKEYYLKKGAKDVLVTDAYNKMKGYPLDNQRFRAVYVKFQSE